jgi:hypothetical protein
MDTIKIKIANYQIQDKHYFKEIKANYFSDSSNHKNQSTNNQFRKELQKQGKYAPLYFIDESNYFGKQHNFLVVEFSAPKIVHGHNLAEVGEKDLNIIIEKLRKFFSLIKVMVYSHDIEKAIVTRIAYSKNIQLNDLYSTNDALQVLSAFNYRPKSQFTATTRKANSEIKFFNNHTHFCVYDKLMKIKNDPKTAEEKELAKKQLPETIRFELTLHNKRAVNQVMQGFYPKQNNYTLADVFKDQIRNTLLQKEIDQIFNHPLKELVVISNTDKVLSNKLFQEYNKKFSKKIKTKYIFDILQTRGLSGLKEEVLKNCTNRTWYRLKKEVKKISQSMQLTGNNQATTNLKILKFILEKFDIKSNLQPPTQQSLFTLNNPDNSQPIQDSQIQQTQLTNSISQVLPE